MTDAKIIDEAIEQEAKVARLAEDMARNAFMTIHDLAKRWNVTVKTARKAKVPVTMIGGISIGRYHPVDVLDNEHRRRMKDRVTMEHLEALAQVPGADEKVRELYVLLVSIHEDAA